MISRSGGEVSFSFSYSARYPGGGIHALPVNGVGGEDTFPCFALADY